MGTAFDDGGTLNYWRMSHRRRLRRDLWATAVGLPLLVLAGWALRWNVGPVVVMLVAVFVVTMLYNYRLARAEKRVSDRLADGVSTAWRQLAVVVNGKPLPVQWATTFLLVTGESYEVQVNGRTHATGTARLVADGDVRQSDVTPETGPNRGRGVAQISRTDGDVLTACAAEPVAPRPTTFTSEPGSGYTLSVWLRVR